MGTLLQRCNGRLKQEAVTGAAGLPGLLLLHLSSPTEDGCFWGTGSCFQGLRV